MSATEVIDIAVSSTEARSIETVASLITTKIMQLGRKWDAELTFDPKRIEEDWILFLARRHTVGLREIRATVLEDGTVQPGFVDGKRRADLLIRIHYKESQGGRVP